MSRDGSAAAKAAETARTERLRLMRLEHRKNHVRLHAYLEIVVSDYLAHHRAAKPSTVTVEQLVEWSYRQTLDPDEL